MHTVPDLAPGLADQIPSEGDYPVAGEVGVAEHRQSVEILVQDGQVVVAGPELLQARQEGLERGIQGLKWEF